MHAHTCAVLATGNVKMKRVQSCSPKMHLHSPCPSNEQLSAQSRIYTTVICKIKV